MKELGLLEAKIVTRDETEKITVNEGVIEVIPVWKFLLEIN
jgi:predicted AAA+ superfamily ATPase